MGMTHNENTAADAHEILVTTLRRFRQGRHTGRSNRGKSNWPDGNTLRALRGTSATATANGIPRAAFGLPLKFEFRHKANDAPANATIYPARGSISGTPRRSVPWSGPDERLRRFASPVVLSLATTTDGITPLILFVGGEQVDALRLEWNDGTSPPKSVPYFTFNGSDHPIDQHLRKSSGDGIKAFRHWAKSLRHRGRKVWKAMP
jgi:hypothetical protein